MTSDVTANGCQSSNRQKEVNGCAPWRKVDVENGTRLAC